MLIISQLTTLISFYWDYISSDIINKHCNEQKLLRWFHYFISILEYKLYYQNSNTSALSPDTQHSTIEWMHKWGTDRSKQDQQEVRSGVSPRYSGDMQHVPCQRGVTLLQLHIQLKRTAGPAEFRKELKAVFCWKIIWLKTANTTQILRVNELTLAFCMCQKLQLLRETAKFQTCEFVEEQNVQLDFRASAWRNYSLVAI